MPLLHATSDAAPIKMKLLLAFCAALLLAGAARAQDSQDAPNTVPAQTSAPQPSPFPAAPTDFPVSQTVEGVTFTVQGLEWQSLPNPKIRNLIVRYQVKSDAPDARPAPGRTLDSYVVSPLWFYSPQRSREGGFVKQDGQRTLIFRGMPSDLKDLKLRVSFLDPRFKVPGKNLNRSGQITFEKVPIPRVLNEPVIVNSTFKAEHGALVTLKTATLKVPDPQSSRTTKRPADDRDVEIVVALQQPAPLENLERKATLEYINSDWDSLFFAYDNKGVEWARGETTFGSPSNAYSDGDFSYTFAFRNSPGATTLDVEFGLREIVTHLLPDSAFRRFFFNLDLKNAKSDANAG